MISQDKLQYYFDYDPSGFLVWKNPTRIKLLGKRAGSTNGRNYRLIMVEGKRYAEHILVWVYHKGTWPTKTIDHKNLNRVDNRIDNLREATYAQQIANQKIKRTNTSGFRNVMFRKDRGKWIAKLGKKYLGSFDTKEDAHKVAEDAAKEYWGEYYRIHEYA